MEEFAERTAEGVLGMIERSLGRLGRETPTPEIRVEVTRDESGSEGRSSVEDIAARAEELARHIEATIRQAREDAERSERG
jgi:hypothetical protein